MDNIFYYVVTNLRIDVILVGLPRPSLAKSERAEKWS